MCCSKVVLVGLTLATTLSKTLPASTAPPSRQGSSGDIKGIARSRMRVDGKRVDGKADIEKHIVKLLERPQTPSMLAAAMNRNAKTLYRDYLKPMLAANKIAKQGDYYTRSGVAAVVVEKERFDDIMAKSGFAQLPALEDLVTHCRGLSNGSRWVTQAWKMCTGRIVPTFKCRPEHWTPETTEQFIAAWKQHSGTDRLAWGVRQLLRHFHEYVLKKPVTDAQKSLLGLDGTKDNAGVYNHVKLSKQQIEALVDYFMQKGDIEAAALAAFSIETFGRSEAIFKAATGTMVLTPRTLYCAQVSGDPEPNFDPVAVRQMRIISAMNPNIVSIKELHDEVFEGTLKEFKTEHAPWPKYIVDQQCVSVFKEYQATRKGRATYFGKDGEKFHAFNVRTNALMRAAYRELGVLHSSHPEQFTAEWYFNAKPCYTFRHVGAHIWLERLGGSYEALSEMGWEDVAIPKKYYAGYNANLLKQRIARKF